MGELKKRIDNCQNYIRNILPPVPKTMLLDVTNICNHNCVFCAHSVMTRKKKLIDENFAMHILKEAYEAGVRETGFYMYGEPLINQKLEEYVAYAKKCGYEYTYITTNGSLLTRERAERLIDSGLDSIKFSINGATKESYLFAHGKDEFELVIENLIRLAEIRRAKNSGMKIYASMVLTKYTEKDGELLKELLGGYVDDFNILPYNTSDDFICRELDQKMGIEGSVRQFHKNGLCFTPFNRIHVTCEGYLTLCCSDWRNYLVIADLNKMSLTEAWSYDPEQDQGKGQYRK